MMTLSLSSWSNLPQTPGFRIVTSAFVTHFCGVGDAVGGAFHCTLNMLNFVTLPLHRGELASLLVFKAGILKIILGIALRKDGIPLKI